jgi:FixJ family two-component response regulator
VSTRLFLVVIDDDPSVRRALHRLLRSSDMEVASFASGESFLEASFPREPDCLVLDVRMPGMTGPQLRDRLTTLGREISVVFITGHAEDVETDAADPSEILRKPFNDQQLLDAIHRAILSKPAD